MRIRRDKGTVSREITRNSGKYGYRAFSARNRAESSASSRKSGKRILTNHTALREYVEEKIIARWSPEQVVKTLERNSQKRVSS